jgi:hypothetical protein
VTPWRLALLGLATAASLAAAPSGAFVITTNQQPFTFQPPHVDVTNLAQPPGFTAAPTPNRDAEGPRPPPASMAATVSPSLFTRKEQYRGDGFSPNSTAQDTEERHYQPAAGFNLKMPIQ